MYNQEASDAFDVACKRDRVRDIWSQRTVSLLSRTHEGGYFLHGGRARVASLDEARVDTGGFVPRVCQVVGSKAIIG